MATQEDVLKAAQDSGVHLHDGQSDAILDYLNEDERIWCYVPATRLRVPRRAAGYANVSILATGSRFIAVIRKEAPQTYWEFIDFPYKSQTGRGSCGMRSYPVRSWVGEWEMQDGGKCTVSSSSDGPGLALYHLTTKVVPMYHAIQGNDPNPPAQPYVPLTALERRTLNMVQELSGDAGGAFVTTKAIADRLGGLPELPEVLHSLARKRLLQHGKDGDGTWGDRPSSKGLVLMKHA